MGGLGGEEALDLPLPLLLCFTPPVALAQISSGHG